MSKQKSARAPSHLGSAGRRLWQTIVSDFEIDRAGQEILMRACEAADRAESAREAIEREGMTAPDRFGQVKPHPLLAIERDSRAAVLAGLKALNLDLSDAGGAP